MIAACLLAGCGPSGPKALVEGDKLVQAGKYPEAVALLKKATDQLPREPRAWNFLGLAYHGSGQPENAIKAYRTALEVSNNNLAAARFNLGSLLLELKRYPDAAGEFSSYTVLQKNDVNGWLNLGRAELRAGQFDAAEKSFRQCTNLNARLPEPYNALGVIQQHRGRARDFKEAFQSFTTALQMQSNYPPAILNLAIVEHYHLPPKPFDYRPYALQRYNEYLALNPRPANAAQIEAIARQLTLELYPPVQAPPPAPPANNGGSKTNQTPATVSVPPTNAPPHTTPTATNAVASASPVQSPVTNRAVAATAPVTNNSSPAIPPKIEATPASAVPRETVAPKPIEPDKPAAIEAEHPPRLAPMTNQPAVVSQPPAHTNKPGLIDRLNPFNYFRKEPKPVPVTVLPANSNAVNLARVEKSGSPGSALVEPSGFPRYPYRALTVPTAGKRDKADADLKTGRTAKTEGRLKDAIAAATKATRDDPSYFTAYFDLGLFSAEAGDNDGSLKAYEMALIIQPDSVAGRFNFAQVLQRAGYILDAVDELEKLLAAHPDEPSAHVTMGNLYSQKLQQPAKARIHYLEALRLDPQIPQATGIRYWLRDNP